MLVILSFTADQLISNTSPSCPLFFFFGPSNTKKAQTAAMKRPLNSCRRECCSENYFWGEIKVHPHVSSQTETFVRNLQSAGGRSEEQPGEEKVLLWSFAPTNRASENLNLLSWNSSQEFTNTWHFWTSEGHDELRKIWRHVCSLSSRRVTSTSSTIFERNRYFLFY